MKRYLCGFLVGLLISGCGSGKRFTLGPIKTFDPDNTDIPEPEDKVENQIWDLADMTFFYQVEKLLNLNWTARKVGKGLSVVKARPADNVNALDEVPNSSWYTARHYHNRMSIAELKRGPNVTDGPDQSAPWTITRGKFEGGTPGFTIRDTRGDYYIMKFDAPDYQEMGSGAEVISTKIFYACGYNVPQNSIVYFDPEDLEIGETAQVVDGGFLRAMTREDVRDMLGNTPRRPDGKIRALASKYVDGKPVGIWTFIGRRDDDPNDRVDHEHRREIRGLRSIGSWISDEDRRAANTLSVYAEDKDSGNKYIKHYIIDMGSTLGSNNIIPHAPKYGNEYLVDPRSIAKQYVSLGTWVKKWEFDERHLNPEFPSIGYYESEIFDPAEWYPTYPNPAFEYTTRRDAFWGAKIVMAFTDEDIRAIVEEAQFSDKRAEEYLIKTMIARRDKVGRHWFSIMNPLDKFRFEEKGGILYVAFNDLAVDGKLELPSDSKYVYTPSHSRSGIHQQAFVEQTAIPISNNGQGFFDKVLANGKLSKAEDRVFTMRIQAQRGSGDLSTAVDVHFYYPGFGKNARVVGVERAE